MKYAFRCKFCGRLHAAEHAGYGDLPHSCTVCGRGVSVGTIQDVANKLLAPDLSLADRIALAQQLATPDLRKVLQPDNWEVLADASADELKSYGLTPDDVERHDPPAAPAHAAQDISVAAQEGIGTKNKA